MTIFEASPWEIKIFPNETSIVTISSFSWPRLISLCSVPCAKRGRLTAAERSEKRSIRIWLSLDRIVLIYIYGSLQRELQGGLIIPQLVAQILIEHFSRPEDMGLDRPQRKLQNLGNFLIFQLFPMPHDDNLTVFWGKGIDGIIQKFLPLRRDHLLVGLIRRIRKFEGEIAFL